MSISAKVRQSLGSSSWIRKMFEEGDRLRKIYGADKVYDFTLGNPDLEPPASFKKRLRELAENSVPGMHKYMSNAGYPETRSAIAAHLNAPRASVPGDQKILVVLDNCEHLAEAAAALTEYLLAECPALSVLATSREPLGVEGEWSWPVPPLDQQQAVQLFSDRARLVASSSTLRTRTISGVTSTHSSCAQNSMACSRSSSSGLAKVSMTSAVDDRMLVSFFSRVTLTSRSSARGLIPTTIPSYVSWPGSTKNWPRSAS